MSNYVDLNGRLVPIEQAAVPAGDVGLLYGIGLFETLRAYRGRIFRLTQHIDRLAASARALDLPLAPQLLPGPERFAALIESNALDDARLRLTVTGGVPTGDEVRGQTLLITAVPVQHYPEAFYEKGVTIMICRRVQNSTDPLAGHKTTCYWPRLQVLHDAQVKQCAEALWFTERNRLAEGCISNVFIAKGQTVKTPPLDTPVLPGITRAAVLELCRRDGLECLETELTIDDLLDADEVFLTNCITEIVPVCRVERRAIGSEKVGAITQQIMAAYRRLVQESTAPAPC